jgi:hypothetical protein
VTHPKDTNPLTVLLLLWANGSTVRAVGDRLVINGPRMCDELREAVRHNKTQLLRVLRPVEESA